MEHVLKPVVVEPKLLQDTKHNMKMLMELVLVQVLKNKEIVIPIHVVVKMSSLAKTKSALKSHINVMVNMTVVTSQMNKAAEINKDSNIYSLDFFNHFKDILENLSIWRI